MFDENTYNKMILNNWHHIFLQEILLSYIASKQHYVQNVILNITYPTFTNILRQICKYSNRKYITHKKYDSATLSGPITVFFISRQFFHEPTNNTSNSPHTF